jgi:Domain of unknown function (DUF5020)
MKKLLILFLFVATGTALSAQNVQLHYDMGKTRKYLTSTVESFKTDKYGSTFYFIDIDYGKAGDKGVEGPQLAYFEIARGIKFWNSPFELHVEYNGGFGQFKASPFNGAYTINDAWLFGGNYTWNTKDYSKIFTLQGMYKNIRGKNDMSFQLTGVWNLQFFKNKVTLSGFADFWREDNIVGPSGNTKATDFVFLTEPQFWFNVTKQFSLGSEVEMSSNFAGHKGFMCNPTVAVKWNL